MESSKKQDLARKRWQILAQVLRRGTCEDVAENIVSVRRFQTFGLLTTSSIDDERSVNGCDASGQWYIYSCVGVSEMAMKIRYLNNTISAERLNGFNNTGNVCVWPSEEVMAFYCMKHVQDFKGQRVCELGGGMTCLAGIALGIYSEACHVEVTDGNDESVSNLHSIIKANDFGSTTMSSRVVRWGEEQTEPELCNAFDTIICADCLFFDTGREALATLIYDMLKPGGTALIFAPSRGATFHVFADIARSMFEVTETENYDDHIWDIHHKIKKKSSGTYDENLHYPLLMSLTKVKSREVTPESR